METVWFMEINGERLGPYSIEELEIDGRITPDTLVWREGFETWILARNVPELASLFSETQAKEVLPDEEMTLQIEERRPNYVLFLILIAIVAFLYVIFAR